MLVKLTKRMRVWHDAGDTVSVSPVDADYLIACRAAVPVVADKPDGAGNKKPAAKKATASK